jgi:serine/threonine protein kinase
MAIALNESDYEIEPCGPAGRRVLVADGQLFKGKMTATGQFVVVKVMHTRLSTDPVRVQTAFQREVEVLAKLEHPAVLPLVGFSFRRSESDPSPVIVTKFLKNGSLDNALAQERNGTPLDGWDATKKSICVFGIAVGMRYVHSKNVIHRNLKPSKVLLDDNLEPCIGGFELSRLVDGSDVQLTMNIGTPFFMAPELFSEDFDDTYTSKIDIFSFAVLLYQMFSSNTELDGGRPWKSAQQYLRGIENGERLKRDPAIPDFYWDLITKCWNSDPNQRPDFNVIVTTLRSNRSSYMFPGTNCSALEEYENRILNPVKH